VDYRGAHLFLFCNYQVQRGVSYWGALNVPKNIDDGLVNMAHV
jgi:hypothetical protein